jgi:hypothetical protein
VRDKELFGTPSLPQAVLLEFFYYCDDLQQLGHNWNDKDWTCLTVRWLVCGFRQVTYRYES